jgi:hypothetical protein
VKSGAAELPPSYHAAKAATERHMISERMRIGIVGKIRRALRFIFSVRARRSPLSMTSMIPGKTPGREGH